MSDTVATRHVEDAYRVLLRRSVAAGGLAGVVCIVAAAVWAGPPGVFSAGIGALAVLVFFSARLLVMKRTARSNPQLVLVAALGVYTAKIVALGILMILLMGVSWIVGPALGLTVIVTAVAWLAAEMLTFTKLRVPVFGGAPPARDGRS